MKNITKSIIAIALIFNCLILFSQVNISMNANGSSSNSAPISNCRIINFQSHNTLNVTFYVNIEKQQQPTFIQGFLLQWLNPKAWIASVAGVSLFSVPDSHQAFLTFSFVYFVVCYLSLFTWSVFGDKVTVVLNSEFRLRLFNRLMGGLLVITAIFLLYSQFN